MKIPAHLYTQSKIGEALDFSTARAKELLRDYINEFPDRKRIMTLDEFEVFKEWLAHRILKLHNLDYLLKDDVNFGDDFQK